MAKSSERHVSTKTNGSKVVAERASESLDFEENTQPKIFSIVKNNND